MSNGTEERQIHPIVLIGIGIAGIYAISKVFDLLAIRRNPSVSRSQARALGSAIGVDWSMSPFSVDEFRKGIEVEMEHGPTGPAGHRGDVTHGDMFATARIALAHLTEFPDYYARLEAMEKAAKSGIPTANCCL